MAEAATILPYPLPDPIVPLWAERNRVAEEAEKLFRAASAADARGDRKECTRLEDEAGQVDQITLSLERAIARREPSSAEGWRIQAGILRDFVRDLGSEADPERMIADRVAAYFDGAA